MLHASTEMSIKDQLKILLESKEGFNDTIKKYPYKSITYI